MTVLLLVVDAVGVSTWEYILDHYPGRPRLPNFSRLGLPRILASRFASRLGADGRRTCAMRVEQASASADSVIGHREMVGITDAGVYELFPQGFPEDFIKALEEKIGRRTIFNKMAGGMEAIALNAEEHEKTGRPIVYASKCDPLIQIAMNEAVIPPAQQHRIAETAFTLARGMGISVTRAIARAYVRAPNGEITRTANRHDAVLPLPGPTLVDVLREAGVWTAAVGKTSDLVPAAYNERMKLTQSAFLDPALGLRFAHPLRKDTNPYNVQGTVNALIGAASLYRPRGSFVFTNLVDADSLYGHTRDVPGAVRCLEEVDRILPLFEKNLGKGDILVIIADHGMRHGADYGYHNKEPLPLIAERIGYGAGLGGLKAGPGKSLCEIGLLIARAFGLEKEYRRDCGFP